MNAHITIKVPNIKQNKPIRKAKNIPMAIMSGIADKMAIKTHDTIAILYLKTFLKKSKRKEKLINIKK